MKWEEKHNKAKEVIDIALQLTEGWKDGKVATGLSDEDRVQVDDELKLMIESIRKRYKIEKKEIEVQEKEEEKPKRTRKTSSTGRKPRTKKEEKAAS